MKTWKICLSCHLSRNILNFAGSVLTYFGSFTILRRQLIYVVKYLIWLIVSLLTKISIFHLVCGFWGIFGGILAWKFSWESFDNCEEASVFIANYYGRNFHCCWNAQSRKRVWRTWREIGENKGKILISINCIKGAFKWELFMLNFGLNQFFF